MAKCETRTLRVIKIIIIAIIILVIANILRIIVLKISYPQKYSTYVERYTEEHQVEKELIYAMIKVESNFKQDAVSNKGALGLMQILESTAYDVANQLEMQITKEEIMNPKINIYLGTKYVSNLIKKYGKLELAVAAYNAGIGNVDRWIESGVINKDGTDVENIPFKETNNYVRKVLRDYLIYKQICN